MMNHYLDGSICSTGHHSKMSCLFIILLFLPFAFGDILETYYYVEPTALAGKRYDYLEPTAFPLKRYDYLEPTVLPGKRYDLLDSSALHMKKNVILPNVTFSNLDWPIEEKLSLDCNLICAPNPWMEINFWSCDWKKAEVPCHVVTREIMKNAKTIYPETPYLMNVSSSPKFGIQLVLKVTDFEDGFLSDYTHLYGFYLSSNDVKKINKYMFEGVQGMKSFDIYWCPALSEIEQGIFQNLTSLEYLGIVKANLSRMEGNLFQGLHSLQQLQVTVTKISRIEANSFTHLPKLTHLFLFNNIFSYIHKDAFMGFKGVELHLENNLISSSDLNSLKNLSGLVQLFLQGNRIRSVPSDIFKNLPHLYRVYLDSNPISSIPTGIFNHSNSWGDIQLGCTDFEHPHQLTTNLTLEKESFVTKARPLNIGIRGCVTEIKQSAFEGLETEFLYLIYSPKLKKLNRTIFEGMRQLEKLGLYGNGVETVDSDTFHDPLFKKLLLLDLRQNKLKTIEPHTFRNLKKLTTLLLSENLITVITKNVFEGVQSLTNLDLGFNKISMIDSNAFSSLDSLVTLNISHNHITSLSNMSFGDLTVLMHLDISYNSIKKISSGDLSYYFHHLKTLHLQGNKILKIEAFWSSGLRLDLLDLSRNHLTTVEIFAEIDMKSKKIILSENNITMIDWWVMDTTRVSEFLLDHNNISHVGYITNIGLETLNHLDLRYNKIKEVSISEMDNLQKIEVLHLNGNPWNCSCKESDKPLMNFLLNLDIISCCPNDCICSKMEAKSVYINCDSKNKSSLPTCLPFEQVKLDYSKNLLPDLTFTSFHENVTHLELNRNLLTKINGSSFTLLKNLSYLDLRFNALKKVPHQFEHLKATTIHLEGNQFLCNDCNLVNTLKAVDKVTPQNFSCEGKETFQIASLICLVIHVITMSVGIIALISGLYFFINKLYMKGLSKSYEHRFVLLQSKEDAHAYKQECWIMQKHDHLNIRKMHKNMTTWFPKWVGHFYLVKMDCSLREAMQDISSGSSSSSSSSSSSLNVPELTRQLLAGIQFLHSRDNPIFITNLSVNSVLLQRDNATDSWILKLGDFSQAIVHEPTQTTDEEATLITSSDHDVTLMQEDLRAAAHIVYFLLTRQEKEEPITMQDLKDEPDIEMCTLILALQNGMTATEALLTAPFQLTDQRVSNLGELNQIFKGLRKIRDPSLEQAEQNACLVIGGKGAWNKDFDLPLLKDFALLHNGYDIISYVCLLRIIRNILQHGHENPSSMLAAFNTKTPSPKQILQKFSKYFPFFYLHSIYCLDKFLDKKNDKFLDERNASGPDIYMKTYQAFETYICRDGESTGVILPLQDKSRVSIQYKAPYEEFLETIFVEGTRSCVYLEDILPQISEKMHNLWPDVSSKELFLKNHEKVVLNYSDPIDATSKLCIPERSSLQVLKPEVTIQLPDQVVMKRFRKNDMVESLKGFLTKFLPPAVRKKEKLKNIIFTFDNEQLKDGQRILDLDFADHAFVVGNWSGVSESDEKTTDSDSDSDVGGMTIFDPNSDLDSDSRGITIFDSDSDSG